MATLVRVAIPSDIPAVHRLLVTTWHDTYDAIFGAEKVSAITSDWHSELRLAAQLDAPQSSFLVAERDGVIVGHAVASLRTPELWLGRLYVLPACQRIGIGLALLSALAARHPDCARMALNVEQDNLKGVAFYRRRGFTVESEAIEGSFKTFRMTRTLPLDI